MSKVKKIKIPLSDQFFEIFGKKDICRDFNKEDKEYINELYENVFSTSPTKDTDVIGSLYKVLVFEKPNKKSNKSPKKSKKSPKKSPKKSDSNFDYDDITY